MVDDLGITDKIPLHKLYITCHHLLKVLKASVKDERAELSVIPDIVT